MTRALNFRPTGYPHGHRWLDNQGSEEHLSGPLSGICNVISLNHSRLRLWVRALDPDDEDA